MVGNRRGKDRGVERKSIVCGSAPEHRSPGASGSPNEFLKAIFGKRVVVRLLSGANYRGKSQFCCCYDAFLTRQLGILTCLDGYMNIALEQTEEYVRGRVTNRYGDAFIRGNSGGKDFRFSFVGFLTVNSSF